jgi:hypothetical protein
VETDVIATVRSSLNREEETTLDKGAGCVTRPHRHARPHVGAARNVRRPARPKPSAGGEPSPQTPNPARALHRRPFRPRPRRH